MGLISGLIKAAISVVPAAIGVQKDIAELEMEDEKLQQQEQAREHEKQMMKAQIKLAKIQQKSGKNAGNKSQVGSAKTRLCTQCNSENDSEYNYCFWCGNKLK